MSYEDPFANPNGMPPVVPPPPPSPPSAPNFGAPQQNNPFEDPFATPNADFTPQSPNFNPPQNPFPTPGPSQRPPAGWGQWGGQQLNNYPGAPIPVWASIPAILLISFLVSPVVGIIILWVAPGREQPEKTKWTAILIAIGVIYFFGICALQFLLSGVSSVSSY